VAFLDFVDASITNVELPHILASLHSRDPNQAHAAEPLADSPLAAAALEPITEEI
jgi:hypothetical protein